MSQNKVKTVFDYNGVSYEFDVRDADTSEKYEDALEKMAKEEKEITKTGKGSEIIRAQCKMLKTFFDNCLGEGAGTAICGEKNNISVCYEAYGAFLDMIATQKDGILASKNTFQKYSNRQQRRAARKQAK